MYNIIYIYSVCVCAENRKKERIKNTFFSFHRVEILCVYQSVYGGSVGRVRTVTLVMVHRRGGRVRRLRWHVPLPPTPVGRQSVRFSLTVFLSFSPSFFTHARDYVYYYYYFSSGPSDYYYNILL